MLTRLAHEILLLFYDTKYKKFLKNRDTLQLTQSEKLKEILSHCSQAKYWQDQGIDEQISYQEFKSKVPVNSYENFHQLIQEQKARGDNSFCFSPTQYQPTSGSSSARKWIPFNQKILDEFDWSIGPWLCDLYKKYPKVKSGRHYWSLSWIPDNLREELKDTNDLDYFPLWKRIFMQSTMATPQNISQAKTIEAAQFASLCYLLSCRNLTLIFIWSPTFLLTLLEKFEHYKDRIIKTLESGQWAHFENDLKGLKISPCAETVNILKNNFSIYSHWKKVWPKLHLVSAWESGPSQDFADKIKNIFQGVNFQGKGLFATECVITIPFQNNYLLSYLSHFYEFECIKSGKILPSWELEEGMEVMPIISSGNGFLRYKLEDRLCVLGKNGEVPILDFKGRVGSTDLVGEKMSMEVADKILKSLSTSKLLPISLIAVKPEARKPYYCALFEGPNDLDEISQMQAKGEAILLEHFHYKLAREMGQLDPFKVVCSDDSLKKYINLGKKRGMIEGDIKISSLSYSTIDPSETD